MSTKDETVSNIRKLRERWSAIQLQEVTRALINCNGTVDLEITATHQIDGCEYVDLRGVDVQEFIANAAIFNVDLSYSLQRGIAGESHTLLKQCRLVGVDFSETVLAVNATNCDFSRSKMKNVFGHFENCSFANTNLNRAFSAKLYFKQCDFRGANMYNTHLFNTIFDCCIWDGCKLGLGSFAESTFINTMPSKEQLGETIMDNVVINLKGSL